MEFLQSLGHFVLSVGVLVTSIFSHVPAVHDQSTYVRSTPRSTVSIQQKSEKTASPSANTIASHTAVIKRLTHITHVTNTDPFYTAARSISSQGHTIYISVKIPKNGGAVTGNISGDCSGIVTGQYDGKDGGVINGKANVSCKYLFMRVPGTANFSGTVSKSDSTAELYVTLDYNSMELVRNVYFNLE